MGSILEDQPSLMGISSERGVLEGTELRTAIARAVTSPAVLMGFSLQVECADPYTDAEELIELGRNLRLLCEESSGQEYDIARLLLERVAGRQSPAAMCLRKLVKSKPDSFTAELVAGLASAEDRKRSLSEITTDEETQQFFAQELAPTGIVGIYLPEHPEGQPFYMLTPAGKGGLRHMAQHVLEREMGRYVWPEPPN